MMIDVINTATWYEVIWTIGALLGFILNFRALRYAYGDRRAVIESDGPNKESRLIMSNILLRISRFLVVLLFGYITIGFLVMLTPSRPDLGDTPVNFASLVNFTFWMILLEGYAIYWGWSYLRDRERLLTIGSINTTAE